ncbi:hypothetical protein XabCFBP2524_13975 [Xanthomonas axonopodis pv. begoniae]|nr:hypothetical protein XabCFBP2524_13975 [Xanthomonas axonopodis pv. begoniae]
MVITDDRSIGLLITVHAGDVLVGQCSTACTIVISAAARRCASPLMLDYFDNVEVDVRQRSAP